MAFCTFQGADNGRITVLYKGNMCIFYLFSMNCVVGNLDCLKNQIIVYPNLMAGSQKVVGESREAVCGYLNQLTLLASAYIINIRQTPANLDNRMLDCVETKENVKWASKIRRIYTYTDQQGKEQTVLINGNTAKDTDKKFQAFLSGVVAVPQEKETPTLKQFIDEVYRTGFMEGLAETTIANYELYIRLYIVPFMGHMRMSEITVATIQNFYNWLATASQHGRNKDLNRNSPICKNVSTIFSISNFSA